MAHKVIIFESQIDRLIRVGEGNRWLKRKADAIKATAVTFAPVGKTGRLKESHRVDQSRDRLGRYQTGFRVSANMPYALYVHEGTGPWIYPKRGRYLTLPGPNPKNPGRKTKLMRNGSTTAVRRVRGQVAKPWLLNAARMHT